MKKPRNNNNRPQPVKEEVEVIEMTPDAEIELSNGKEEGEE